MSSARESTPIPVDPTAPEVDVSESIGPRDRIPSVTFFFPYRDVSGVPVVFSRMALYLANRCGIDTRVVDYPDGYMARTLAGGLVHLIPFVPSRPLPVEDDTIFVMQSLLPYSLRRELQFAPRTRMLFWTLHPFNWVPTLLPLDRVRHAQAVHPRLNRLLLRMTMPRVRWELGRLLIDLQRAKSVAFMDQSTFRSTCELLGVSLEVPRFLPVPCFVPGSNRKATTSGPRPSILSVAWLGRVADFKIHVLVHTLRQLARAARHGRFKVALHVIGDGPHTNLLGRIAQHVDNVQVVHEGVLTGEELENFLVSRVDLLAAMGASALDGGRLGLPTILLDPSYGPVPPGYGYRWLFESSGYSLGEFVRPFAGPRRPLQVLLEELEADYWGTSERTYRYCRDHHMLEHVGQAFLQVAGGTKFLYGDFRPPVLRRGLVRRGYELYRDITHG